jgi:predicted metalloprotease
MRQLQISCQSGSSCRQIALLGYGPTAPIKRPRDWNPGDIESGLNAAGQIADDTIQKRTQGIAVPETFSHGSAEQRMRWFRNGLESGQLSACNTFSSETP